MVAVNARCRRRQEHAGHLQYLFSLSIDDVDQGMHGLNMDERGGISEAFFFAKKGGRGKVGAFQEGNVGFFMLVQSHQGETTTAVLLRY